MPKRPKVLLQTTIATPVDDWGIVRFSKLAELLRSEGFDVVARDRDPLPAPDSVLSTLDTSDFDAA